MNKIFVERLNSLYRSTGLSQTQYARKIGVAQGTVARWLSGEYMPTVESIEIISNYHHKSVDWMLGIEHVDEKDILDILAEQVKVFQLTGQKFVSCEKLIDLINTIKGEVI
jgi:transcriptional regulator with XRE-family HTH domain